MKKMLIVVLLSSCLTASAFAQGDNFSTNNDANFNVLQCKAGTSSPGCI